MKNNEKNDPMFQDIKSFRLINFTLNISLLVFYV